MMEAQQIWRAALERIGMEDVTQLIKENSNV
jgi:hypothetical protein